MVVVSGHEDIVMFAFKSLVPREGYGRRAASVPESKETSVNDKLNLVTERGATPPRLTSC